MKALITGTSDGIGGAIARDCARRAAAAGHGALALSTSGRKGAPEALLAEIAAMGVAVRHFPADLRDPGACQRLATEALDFCGGMDAFLSNAGAMRNAPLAEVTVADWDALFASNTRPTLLIAQALLPALTASRGAIVAVGSTAGATPSLGCGSYSPSKAALAMLIRQMALEWAPLGVRANLVAPGLVRTPLTEAAYQDAGTHAARLALVPMGRIGTPEDIARAVGFLASAEAGYATGQILTLDGGLTDSIYRHLPMLQRLPD